MQRENKKGTQLNLENDYNFSKTGVHILFSEKKECLTFVCLKPGIVFGLSHLSKTLRN